MLNPGAEGGYVELEGSPDMVLEVVSKSSVQKDTDILLDKYWRADVSEYWLADARGEELKFEIHQHTGDGYRLMPSADDGWISSAVFGCEFRLIQEDNGLGHPRFVLERR